MAVSCSFSDCSCSTDRCDHGGGIKWGGWVVEHGDRLFVYCPEHVGRGLNTHAGLDPALPINVRMYEEASWLACAT